MTFAGRASLALLFTMALARSASAGDAIAASIGDGATAPASSPDATVEARPSWRPAAWACAGSAGECRWYGAQILAVDAASGGMIALGGALDQWALGAPGGAGLALGAPALHLAHGHGGRALGSLGIRLGAGLLAFGATAAWFADHGSDSCAHRDCSATPLDAELVVIGATASVIDALVLGWESREPGPRPASMTITPHVMATASSAAVGVGGVF